MNILIVDDDKLIRMFLQSLMSKKIECKIHEAENGVEALLVLENNPVDLILLDISMPIMDGYELLKIIRTTTAISSIPVIVMSSSDEKNIVIKLIQLGISDYILKPFKNRILIFERIMKALPIAKEKSNERRAYADKSGIQKLLIIDKDPNFRAYFAATFSDKFSIIETSSGAEGIKKFLEIRPDIVCASEGLPIMNALNVALKISSLDKEMRTKFYFLYENFSGEYSTSPYQIFSKLVKKTFVPDIFRDEFLRAILGETSPINAFIEIIKTQLSPELITSIQQTFGVMSMQEVNLLPETEISTIQFEHFATVDLLNKTEKIKAALGIALSNKDILSLAKRIDDDEDVQSIIALLETVAGRICSSLSLRGYNFSQQFVSTDTKYETMKNSGFSLLFPFETENLERFAFGLFIDEI